jgi:SMI1/KNR4 family protein SUKH-1
MPTVDEIMKNLEFTPISPDLQRSPSEEEIARFEAELGGKLPPVYRDFVKRYGVTSPERGARFPIAEPNPWGKMGTLRYFLGFSPRPHLDIVHQTVETYAGRIPDETIPIATDPGGNLILLGFDGPPTDQVYFWDHEHREAGEDEMDRRIADLESKGEDTNSMDEHALIRRWEELFPEKLTKPARFSNVYRVADTFMAFLESLQPHPDYNG